MAEPVPIHRRSYASWPGTPAPVVGASLRYHATPSAHDSRVLNCPINAQLFALDWFTADGLDSRPVFHALTVPQAFAEEIGLAFAEVTSVAAVVTRAETAGYTVTGVAQYLDFSWRGADPAIAAALGVPGARILWAGWSPAVAQRLGDDRRPLFSRPLFVEWTYTW